ncbi:DUF362 domain-containing protein [Megamonas hypermegale]|uniref:DUF362 domain-containing protein n=1 Tax=Megamonas hypermegale TaxID=158847 RepID=UPI001957EA45|nr:DUF362 domain-containing protein [Megamonas hypermegale]MBM6762008.1 DUF362 domain-containing protein [Megamonas hypermegale]
MKVAVERAENYQIENVDRAINNAVDFIGGWEKYIKKGDKVLIKPNLLTAALPQKAVTTHPEVVRSVIKAVKKLGAKPFVADSPGVSNVKKTAEKTGILQVCQEEKTPFIFWEKSKIYPCREGKFVKHFELADTISDFDKIISVAKMKTHVFMGVTGAVKNLFGCIVGTNKARFHLRMQKHADFAHVMVDLYYTVKPTLNIIDGISGMEGQGPMSGDIVNPKLVIVSEDGFAADLVMADKMGFNAENMPIAAAAIEEQRSVHLKDIEVVGSGKDIKFAFKRPHTYESMQDTYVPKFILKLGQNQLTSKPVINKNCVGCRRCEHHCPPKAINIKAQRAVIDYHKCIRCYCCQELCEHQAVDLKDGWILALLKKLGIYKV